MNIQGLPGNIKVPFLYFGVDASQAGFFENQSRVLLVGHKLPAGTALDDTPIQVLSNENDLFGPGSMLSNMVRAARRASPFTEIWAMPIPEAVGAVANELTLGMISTPFTQAEAISFVVNGKVYSASVAIGDTSTDLRDAMMAALNADPDNAFTVSPFGAASMKILAKNKGIVPGKITFNGVYNYLNVAQSTKVTYTLTETGGAGNPTLSALAVTGITNGFFDWVGSPFWDAPFLQSLRTLYDDITGLWGPMQQVYGHVLTAVGENLAALGTLGDSQNNQHLSLFGINGSPTPIYEISAVLAATAQRHLSDAPELSRPLQTIQLQGVLPPAPVDQFDTTSRQSLYLDGIGSYTVSRSGETLIDRVLTTYKTNNAGAADTAYQDIQTLAQLQYFIRYIDNRITRNYPRVALRDDTDILVPGNVMVRPKDVRSTIIAAAFELENLGVIENAAAFAQLLRVERDPTDPNCLLMVISPDFVNQFRIGKILVQFYLQYPQSEG